MRAASAQQHPRKVHAPCEPPTASSDLHSLPRTASGIADLPRTSAPTPVPSRSLECRHTATMPPTALDRLRPAPPLLPAPGDPFLKRGHIQLLNHRRRGPHFVRRRDQIIRVFATPTPFAAAPAFATALLRLSRALLLLRVVGSCSLITANTSPRHSNRELKKSQAPSEAKNPSCNPKQQEILRRRAASPRAIRGL